MCFCLTWFLSVMFSLTYDSLWIVFDFHFFFVFYLKYKCISVYSFLKIMFHTYWNRINLSVCFPLLLKRVFLRLNKCHLNANIFSLRYKNVPFHFNTICGGRFCPLWAPDHFFTNILCCLRMKLHNFPYLLFKWIPMHPCLWCTCYCMIQSTVHTVHR